MELKRKSKIAAKLLFVDASAGAAGDMILGALVDLGVPASRIREAVRSLPLEGWTIRPRKVTVGGIAARKVDVRVGDTEGGRNWRQISRILKSGGLDAPVRDRALAIFRRLFEAEAQVHGGPVEKIHLHEAGAVDAVIDIVGACVGLEHLAPDRIIVSPMATGSGTVRCRHGEYPVPAPATAVLIQGVPAGSGGLSGERLTPTGAAILTSVADRWSDLPLMRARRTGYGAGDRDFGDRPNLLRMVIGEADAGFETDRLSGTAVIECTLDDANPQVVAFASERLFSSGALEVYSVPAQMKKGRAGVQLTVLCRPEEIQAVSECLLRETTTLGLRFRIESRIEMERSFRKVRTRFGTVSIKIGRLGGQEYQAWPEYEDCAALARKHGVPLKRIQEEAMKAYRSAAGRARKGESDRG